MTSTNLFISPKKLLHRVTDYAGNTSDLYTPNASNDFKMCAQNPQAIKMWSILQYLVCGNMDLAQQPRTAMAKSAKQQD